MKLEELINSNLFQIVNRGNEADRQVKGVFCCDMLSIAMGKAPMDCAWVTVVSNINTLAVASLADVSCIVLAEGVCFDQAGLDKMKEENITVLSSKEPIFETALKINNMIKIK